MRRVWDGVGEDGAVGLELLHGAQAVVGHPHHQGHRPRLPVGAGAIGEMWSERGEGVPGQLAK